MTRRRRFVSATVSHIIVAAFAVVLLAACQAGPTPAPAAPPPTSPPPTATAVPASPTPAPTSTPLPPSPTPLPPSPTALPTPTPPPPTATPTPEMPMTGVADIVGLWVVNYGGSRWQYKFLADGHTTLTDAGGIAVGSDTFVVEGQKLRFLSRTPDCPQTPELGYYEVYVTKRGDQSERLRLVLVGYDCPDRKRAFSTSLVPWK